MKQFGETIHHYKVIGGDHYGSIFQIMGLAQPANLEFFF
ncbi:MAG: hypothetical protein Ct9H90mP20_5480 [Candidatus Neomarinimicrobiota bacterium]|nr:MAG: hypothetical protein Ct9H90mP20_5480 [Candidatus Neomarinimicrobiota bacterium]